MEHLIDTAQIEKYTQLNVNDVDRYLPLIEYSQEKILEEVLGTRLYEKLLEDYPVYSGKYETMYNEYIVKILCNDVAAEYVETSPFEVTSGGVFLNTANETQLPSDKQIIRLVSAYRNRAEMYINRLNRFLKYERENIPEYNSQENPYDIDSEQNDSYNTGLFLEDYD